MFASINFRPHLFCARVIEQNTWVLQLEKSLISSSCISFVATMSGCVSWRSSGRFDHWFTTILADKKWQLLCGFSILAVNELIQPNVNNVSYSNLFVMHSCVVLDCNPVVIRFLTLCISAFRSHRLSQKHVVILTLELSHIHLHFIDAFPPLFPIV